MLYTGSTQEEDSMEVCYVNPTHTGSQGPSISSFKIMECVFEVFQCPFLAHTVTSFTSWCHLVMISF